MLARIVDRMPVLLLLGVLVVCAQVALFERDEPRLLLPALPAGVLLLLYLGSARRSRRS